MAITPSRRSSPCRPLVKATLSADAEVGVLAVGLVDATPAGVAGDVHHRRERLEQADAAHLPTDEVGHLLDGVRVPARGQADRCREHGEVRGEDAVEGLVVEDRRDAQAGAFDQEALDLVDGARRLSPGTCGRTSRAPRSARCRCPAPSWPAIRSGRRRRAARSAWSPTAACAFSSMVICCSSASARCRGDAVGHGRLGRRVHVLRSCLDQSVRLLSPF